MIDVEQIAENTPSEVIDGWEAFERCEPSQNLRYGLAIIARELTKVQVAQTGNEELKKDVQKFMPGYWIEQPEPQQPATIEETEQVLASRFG